jgi:hypothetical protein
VDPRAGAWSLLVIGACSAQWDDYDPRLASSAVSTGSGGGAGGDVTVSSGGAGAQGGAGASGGTGAAPAWLDDGLTARRPLDVSLPVGIDETLTDFPVVVRLDAARHPDLESELRFGLDDHQTVLAHEIERWDDDGESIVWVEVPSIDATVSRIWMYYGGSPLTTMIDPVDVWSNGFVAVWHLGEQLVDSTIGGHDGVAAGAAPVSGLVGSGTTFDGGSDYVDVSAAPVFDELFVTGGTLSVFIRPTSGGEVDRGRIIDRTTTTSFADGWSLLMSHYATPDSVGFAYGFVGSFGWWTTPPGSIIYGEWHHVAASFSEVDPEPSLYVDGVPQTVVVEQTPVGLPPGASDLAVRIGGRSGGQNRDYLGEMDELRVAHVVRTPGWIAAEALGAIVTIGEPETKP